MEDGVEDLVELGIEGADKLIDVGFDYLPSRALHIHNPDKKKRKDAAKADVREDFGEPRNYKSADDYQEDHKKSGRHDHGEQSSRGSNRGNGGREVRGTGPRSKDKTRELKPELENARNFSTKEDDSEVPFGEYIYENDRYQYPQAKYGGDYSTGHINSFVYKPETTGQISERGSFSTDSGRRPYRYGDYIPANARTSQRQFDERTSRPQMRSRSSHEQGRYDYNDNTSSGSVRRTRSSRRSSSKEVTSTSERSKNKAEELSTTERVKNKAGEYFNDSDAGIGAAGLGAVAAGYAAYKLGRKSKIDPVLIGLVGAALGGLGANAIETKAVKKESDRGKDDSRGYDDRTSSRDSRSGRERTRRRSRERDRMPRNNGWDEGA